MARKHNLDEVLRALKKKNACKIKDFVVLILSDFIWSNKENKLIPNPHKKNDIGNGSWGKIDFLTNYNGFGIVHVYSF